MRRLVTATAVAFVLLLGGCSTTDDYPEATSQSLQEGVLAVSQLSAAGDWAGAALALDDVAARLAAAVQAGAITGDRAQDVSLAIELVRTDLQSLIAAQQVPVEEEVAPDEGNGNGNDKPGKPEKPEKEEKDKPGKKP